MVRYDDGVKPLSPVFLDKVGQNGPAAGMLAKSLEEIAIIIHAKRGRVTLAGIQAELEQRVVRLSGSDLGRAAKSLGMTRSTLRKHISQTETPESTGQEPS